MPRKPLTDEQKERMRANLAKARAARAQKASEPAAPTPEELKPNEPIQEQVPTATQPKETNTEPDVAQLTKMVLELQQALLNQQFQTAAPQGLQQAQIAGGRVIGVQEKYTTSRSAYEDPRPRLLKEPRLQRIAFDLNYELEYDMTTTQYETKSGVIEKQPKFHIKLNQVILDDRGEPTNKRMGRAQLIFFEDPETAIKIAHDLGLDVNVDNEAAFLNDMRYIRIRDWLFECFWPALPDQNKQKVTEMVVDGQVVRTWEVSVPEGQNVKIDYSSLGNSRLKG